VVLVEGVVVRAGFKPAPTGDGRLLVPVVVVLVHPVLLSWRHTYQIVADYLTGS